MVVAAASGLAALRQAERRLPAPPSPSRACFAALLIATCALLCPNEIRASESAHAPPTHSSASVTELNYGLALSAMNRHAPSRALGYFRRALHTAETRESRWAIRMMYAQCLNDAAFKSVQRLGVAGPEEAMSRGRIALIREAVAQIDTAGQVAPDPRSWALTQLLLARIFEIWGFPVDAYGWYRGATIADPDFDEAYAGVQRAVDRMRAPAVGVADSLAR